MYIKIEIVVVPTCGKADLEHSVIKALSELETILTVESFELVEEEVAND